MSARTTRRPTARSPRAPPPPTESEWVEWHRQYDHDTHLRGRLRIVRRAIRAALDRCPPGPIRAVSMCAGDGRDLLGALRGHPRRADVRARLVELTPEIAAAGRAAIARRRLTGIHYVVEDAGTTNAYEGAVPAQVVLACGVFGNVRDEDIRATIAELPRFCTEGATVIWTRTRAPPDLTPTIRSWFRDAGFEEVAFYPVPRTDGSVGVQHLAGRPRPWRRNVRLFTFLPRQERASRWNRTPGASASRRPSPAGRPRRPTARG